MDFSPSVGFLAPEDVVAGAGKVASSGPAEGDSGREAERAGEEGAGAGEVGAVALAGFEEEIFERVVAFRDVDFERGRIGRG